MRNKLIVSIVMIVILANAICTGFKVSAEYSINNKDAIQVVYDYFNTIASKEFVELANFYLPEERDEIVMLYSNTSNEANHIALFNIQTLEVINIDRVSENDYNDIILIEDEEKTNYIIYEVQLNLDVFNEDDFYSDGINRYYIILKKLNNDYYVKSLQVPNIIPEIIDIPEIMPNGLDTPILQSSYPNPSVIKVYRTATGAVDLVGFKSYCYCVAANEFGYSSWPSEALKACALASKVYALHNYYYYKDASRGYHISDTGANAQKYDPSKANITACSNAVDNIWSYIIVDKNGALIRSFYRAGENNGLGFHEGKLYQNGCVYLSNAFHMDYKEMITYYYSRTSNISYYNNEVPVGAVRVAYQS